MVLEWNDTLVTTVASVRENECLAQGDSGCEDLSHWVEQEPLDSADQTCPRADAKDTTRFDGHYAS